MEMNKVFKDGLWSKEINVSDFVHTNITPYEGDASFLAGPTERTKKVWNDTIPFFLRLPHLFLVLE